MSNLRSVHLEWTGEGMAFTGRGTQPAGPAITIDGDGADGPSPMLALLLAAAGCAGSDVVVILEKMRVQLRRLAIDVTGTRRDEEPKRYTEIAFRFTMSGDGLDRAKAERAVSLSLEKYCSVVHSLAPDIHVRSDVELA